ncbi:MAG: hypothetical protein DRP88_04385 [Candidatus Neomarinimicrobiota bacterium]|nr:MAG: hypothetical protein DRP88_04385 [Candidatus Neomarinimicrobiota bacterium]
MTLKKIPFRIILAILFLVVNYLMLYSQTYKIVDTGQDKCYNNNYEISPPSPGEAFFGQDAQFNGYQPSYTDDGDGTITDNVTGLMWSKSPDLNRDDTINAEDKLTYHDALTWADTLTLAGYDDWRLPTVKELYSLIMFYGIDPSGYTGQTTGLKPFIDTDYFEFAYGDKAAGERIIDAQFATSTRYVSTTMDGNETIFGVNFADGRIKGYPITKKFYVLFVRGNPEYGKNNFVDNGDGTISDLATGLMWQKGDSEKGMNWQEALAWVQQKNDENFLGYNDWRLPNIKELQSIVDYSRSPTTSYSAAIDPLFQCSIIIDEGGNENYPFYWSSTTHVNMQGGKNAAYIAFGEGLGWMTDPFGNNPTLMDVHGAGCQRSDPKQGDPLDWPYGRGPQGDVIRIYNYVRLVRDINPSTSTGHGEESIQRKFELGQNYPNPFNSSTTIMFSLPFTYPVTLRIYDITGCLVTTLIEQLLPAGIYQFHWNAQNLPNGVYLHSLKSDSFSETKRMILLK